MPKHHQSRKTLERLVEEMRRALDDLAEHDNERREAMMNLHWYAGEIGRACEQCPFRQSTSAADIDLRTR